MVANIPMVSMIHEGFYGNNGVFQTVSIDWRRGRGGIWTCSRLGIYRYASLYLETLCSPRHDHNPLGSDLIGRKRKMGGLEVRALAFLLYISRFGLL